jgi:bile acid-coenzyme A ligase
MLAERDPHGVAVVLVSPRDDKAEEHCTWSELDQSSNRLARALSRWGVGPGALVGLALPNGLPHVQLAWAVWKLGGTVLPIRWDLPEWEQRRLLASARPRLLIGHDPVDGVPCASIDDLVFAAADESAESLPDCAPANPFAIGTGGSTGTPKVVIMPTPGVQVPGMMLAAMYEMTGLMPPLTHLVSGPLYHGNPFSMLHQGLLDGHRMVLMERFDADAWIQTVDRHEVQFACLVPTMMRRIADRVPHAGSTLPSLLALLHTAAACPPDLKRAWIALIGAERVFEAFGSTEGVGIVAVRGDEWLQHPGTLGRPFHTDVRILDDDGLEVQTGTVGEIFMRFHGSTGPGFRYLGDAAVKQTPDGFVSVGDLGWLDAGGWLYGADRRVDMIITGGANVYPAEVEAALADHPGVQDIAVVGLPDRDWGRRVHAVIELREPATVPETAEFDRYVRGRLAAYKVPKSYSFVERLPRDPMGKLRRSALVDSLVSEGL